MRAFWGRHGKTPPVMNRGGFHSTQRKSKELQDYSSIKNDRPEPLGERADSGNSRVAQNPHSERLFTPSVMRVSPTAVLSITFQQHAWMTGALEEL
jgi:hypothetical protein